MSEVRKFRWVNNTNHPEKTPEKGYGPNDGYDYIVETGETVPVVNGVQEPAEPQIVALLKLLGMFPSLDVLVAWAENPNDDLQEVTV